MAAIIRSEAKLAPRISWSCVAVLRCPHHPCPCSGAESWPTTGMTPRGRAGLGAAKPPIARGTRRRPPTPPPSLRRPLQRKQLSLLSAPIIRGASKRSCSRGDDRRATPPTRPGWKPADHLRVQTPTSEASPSLSALSRWVSSLSFIRHPQCSFPSWFAAARCAYLVCDSRITDGLALRQCGKRWSAGDRSIGWWGADGGGSVAFALRCRCLRARSGPADGCRGRGRRCRSRFQRFRRARR